MEIGLAMLALASSLPAPATGCPDGYVARNVVVRSAEGSTVVRRCFPLRRRGGVGDLTLPSGPGSCGRLGACASDRVENLLRRYGQTPRDFGLREDE